MLIAWLLFNSLTMPRKHKRNCPICGKSELKNLSSHLDAVHDMDGARRTKYLIIANPMLMGLLTESKTAKENMSKNAQTKSVKSMNTSHNTELTKTVLMKERHGTCKMQLFSTKSIMKNKNQSKSKKAPSLLKLYN